MKKNIIIKSIFPVLFIIYNSLTLINYISYIKHSVVGFSGENYETYCAAEIKINIIVRSLNEKTGYPGIAIEYFF
jgi:hypothetical protein